MSPWKKITSLFVLSMSTALLGAACVGQVEDATELQDPAAQVEDTEQAESELTMSEPIRLAHHGRRRCERECRQEYYECLKGGDHGWDHGGRRARCQKRLDHCMDRCRHH